MFARSVGGRATLAATLLVLFATGCSVERSIEATPGGLTDVGLQTANVTASPDAAILALGDSINASLAAQGADFRIDNAEWIGENAVGQLVLFNDRGNKRLPEDWVPGDPRRGGRTNITYVVDQVDRALTIAGGSIVTLPIDATTAAIARAMDTWEGLSCSTIPIQGLANPAGDLGVMEFLVGRGGSPVVFADITHAGWVPSGTFPEALMPLNALAVTFTFIWVQNGQPTDIDNNGAIDVAFREIYYSNRFAWSIDGDFVDVETIALHEAGHGLSQAHFGKAFITESNDKLHFAPRAVMNAAYSGIQQTLAGTDQAGHCSNWASWPAK